MTFLGSSGGIHGGEFELPSVLAYSIGVVMGVLARVALVGLRASLKDSNGLIRYDGDRIFIKWRSFYHYHLPADDYVAVEIETSKIQWIRCFRQKRVIPDSDRSTEESWTYLDLRLDHPDTAELSEH